jgi:hypothetical protein
MCVVPLLPWLTLETRFCEPCVREGSGHLKRAGHILVGAYDLPTDARIHHYDLDGVDCFVTNPPYWGQPKDLHPLIWNLSDQAPCWLWLPSD